MATQSIIQQLQALRNWEKETLPSNVVVTPEYAEIGDANYVPTGKFKVIEPGIGDGNESKLISVIGKEAIVQGLDSEGNTTYNLDRNKYKEVAFGPKPQLAGAKNYAEALKNALDAGVDLRPLYGETYADAVKFKQDLGQYAGKDESMIIPANPVGYGGQFKFDPNFGSAFYRDLATQAGKALGLSDEDILNLGTSYFKDKFASGSKTAGVIGFTDFGKGLIDRLARVGIGRQLAANGQLFIDDGDNGGAFVTPDYLRGYENQLASDGNVFSKAVDEKIKELNIGDRLKPLYDASSKVFSGLNGAARVESQSSGFFKGIGQDIAKLGPIGTIALTAALGPAAGALAGSLGGGAALAAGLAAGGASALPGLLQGDISGAIKSGLTGGALAGIGAGALKGVGSSVSNAVNGGLAGDVLSGAATGAIKGGIGSLATGQDLGKGILAGGVTGGASGGINNLLRPTPTVGGIDDSEFDLGKSTDRLEQLGGVPLGDFNIGNLDDRIRSITGAAPPVQAPIGGGLTQLVNRGLVGGALGSNFTISTPPNNYTPSVGGFNIGEYDKRISGISGTSLAGSDFGGGLANNSGALIGGGASQFVNRDGFGNVTGTTVTLAPPERVVPTTTQPTTARPNLSGLIRGLLGLGGAAAVARGIGSLGGPNQQVPAQPDPGGVANIPAPLERDLGFQFQSPAYTAGLGGQLLQPVSTSPLLLPSVQAPNYLRQFAEGGQVEAMNSGLGALPMGGRFLEGPGDGMSDDIPANIDGEEPVMLTDGEYIIPAQAVSALGNGSSKAGAKVLDDMVKRVYTQQTGKPKQMKPINKRVLAA